MTDLLCCVLLIQESFVSLKVLLCITMTSSIRTYVQVSVGVAGLALGYYCLLREPTPAKAKSKDSEKKGSLVSNAAKATVGTVLPGTVGGLQNRPPSVVIDELDAETRRHTSGKHWQQQREQQGR